jgi:competence transcription factor ComK
MRTIQMDDNEFYGNTSRPGTATFIDNSCKACGSSLAGRKEAVRTRIIGGVRFQVELFRCRCGRARELRRAA